MNVVFPLVEEASGICRPWDGSNKVHRLSGTSGTFFSPDYPVPYPKDFSCIWTISVPSGKRVKLKFEDFDLKFPSGDYVCNQHRTYVIDSVLIGNGQDPDSNGFAVFCAYDVYYSIPSEYYSAGRDMWIKFYANRPRCWGTCRGFKVRYEAVDICKY